MERAPTVISTVLQHSSAKRPFHPSPDRSTDHVALLCCRPTILHKMHQDRLERRAKARAEAQRQVDDMRQEATAGAVHLKKATDGARLLDSESGPEPCASAPHRVATDTSGLGLRALRPKDLH